MGCDGKERELFIKGFVGKIHRKEE